MYFEFEIVSGIFSHFLLVMPTHNVHSCEGRESKSCQQIHKRTPYVGAHGKERIWITNDDVLNRSGLETRHLRSGGKKSGFFLFSFAFFFLLNKISTKWRRRILKTLLFCFSRRSITNVSCDIRENLLPLFFINLLALHRHDDRDHYEWWRGAIGYRSP